MSIAVEERNNGRKKTDDPGAAETHPLYIRGLFPHDFEPGYMMIECGAEVVKLVLCDW